MSHDVINAALATHLDVLNLPTAWENKPFAPTEGLLYVEEAYLPGPTVKPGLEHGATRDFSGIYQVTVWAPRDKGKAAAYTTAEQVAQHFAPGSRITRDGVTVEINQPPDQAPAALVGDRFAVPVSVNWRALVR